MPVTYTREIKFTLPGGSAMTVDLPAHTRGVLKRFLLIQVAGDAGTPSFGVYNREGVCFGRTDKNVVGGGYTEKADAGGKTRLTVADTSKLRAGQTVILKDTGVAAFEFAPVSILEVISETQFVVDHDFNGAMNDVGTWQKEPLTGYEFTAKAMHAILTGDIVSGQVFDTGEIEQAYENRDNQDVHSRRRATSLYLEIESAGPADTQWAVSISTAADIGD